MKQLDWNQLDSVGRAAALSRAPQTCSPELREGVSRIIADVRARGDEALRELSARYDGCALNAIEVDDEEFEAADESLAPALRDAIREAAQRIEAYHRATALRAHGLDTAPGVRMERILRPVDRVGLYVPAGTAPLPSTALMLGIPARIAGCSQVVLSSPARPDGRCDAAVLFAARLTGVHRVFRLGGAQAIAAMAYGTVSVPRCDKLFGPGNAWVTEAKLQVSMDLAGAAIDMPAGPSEVMVIADEGANPVYVAADLLSQAEHGADSQAMLVTPSGALLSAVRAELARQCVDLPRREIVAQALEHGCLILVDSIREALDVANAYAPEHLIVQVEAPRTLLDGIRNAGAVFLGPWSPESVGDYCSGSNHVLPTYGNARTFSGLSVLSYQKQITVQELSAEGLRNIGACTATLAAAEQLEAHRRAVTLRLADLDQNAAALAHAGGAAP